MKYQGSKRRIAKHLIPIMMQYVKNEDTVFYDVCCGGANLIDKVLLKNRIAIDKDEYLIEALKVIRDNPEWLPKNNKEFTEQDYKEIQRNKDKYPKWLVGYVGYALS
jgi:DNA adenine methylase